MLPIKFTGSTEAAIIVFPFLDGLRNTSLPPGARHTLGRATGSSSSFILLDRRSSKSFYQYTPLGSFSHSFHYLAFSQLLLAGRNLRQVDIWRLEAFEVSKRASTLEIPRSQGQGTL